MNINPVNYNYIKPSAIHKKPCINRKKTAAIAAGVISASVIGGFIIANKYSGNKLSKKILDFFTGNFGLKKEKISIPEKIEQQAIHTPTIKEADIQTPVTEKITENIVQQTAEQHIEQHDSPVVKDKIQQFIEEIKNDTQKPEKTGIDGESWKALEKYVSDCQDETVEKKITKVGGRIKAEITTRNIVGKETTTFLSPFANNVAKIVTQYDNNLVSDVKSYDEAGKVIKHIRYTRDNRTHLPVRILVEEASFEPRYTEIVYDKNYIQPQKIIVRTQDGEEIITNIPTDYSAKFKYYKHKIKHNVRKFTRNVLPKMKPRREYGVL